MDKLYKTRIKHLLGESAIKQTDILMGINEYRVTTILIFKKIIIITKVFKHSLTKFILYRSLDKVFTFISFNIEMPRMWYFA